MSTEKVMLSLEEQLRADNSGELAAAINERLEEIELRLAALHRQPQSLADHEAIKAAEQAVQGAQTVMQLYEISLKSAL